jgi:hypothetical protein
VKVCPYCAEELPDDATVSPECHKDPNLAPAWVGARRPDDVAPWWSEDAGPTRELDSPYSVPGHYEGLEPGAARRRLLPFKVSASIVCWVAWLFLGSTLARLQAASWQPTLELVFGLGLSIAGVIFGVLGWEDVKDPDRTARSTASFAIAFNAYHLVLDLTRLPHLLRRTSAPGTESRPAPLVPQRPRPARAAAR